MFSIKEILKSPKSYEKRLKTKDPDFSISPLIASYEDLCNAKKDFEKHQYELNRLSKEIGERRGRGEDVEDVMQVVSALKKIIEEKSRDTTEKQRVFDNFFAQVPNVPDEDLKVSHDVHKNVCIKEVGKPKKFDFPIRSHMELGDMHGLFDFKRGAKLSGSGWPVYTGVGARLEWALLSLMIDTHVRNGFTFCLLPNLVRPEIMYGSGQLPKFESQLFKITDEDYNLYLLPTAEVALNGLHYDEILDEEDLPKMYLAYTPCYRREAGAAGKNERGLIRTHQFNKIEMFAFATPEHSDAVFDKMMASAEEVLDSLELHYKEMLLVTGDTSFAASRTVDIEVYLPSQDKKYYEVSSISNCRDFQARRSKTRYRNKDKKLVYLHTLNGSGLATSRLMVSLLENNQDRDGKIHLPKILHEKVGKTIPE